MRTTPAAVDRFVTDDFFIVSGGETVSGRENFKKWIEGFLAQLTPAPAGHRVVRERRR
jgi:hypothetical protein